ncbi:MAG TPA: FAD-binding oxidoreductase [Acidimicrobiales bacterium]|nr:FAD-binding oxidoreductase [Acidimicrobiales bacterium]
MSRPAGAVDAFLSGCRAAVGAGQVLDDPDLTASYTVDWTGRWRGATPAVVRPGDTGEVAEVVTLARRHGVALVPQGGNTGLVGGGVPLAGEVVVSLGRLADLGPVDTTAAQVTAGAGVTLAGLAAHAAAAGLAFGVDLGARDSATVGGMVATNAGGIHVVRYGAMRAQVVGVEAVLGTGAVVSRLGGLVKDNTGYDLAQLLCGSEGTLGIVTAARLRLVAPPAERATALVALPDVAAAVALAVAVRAAVPDVLALELMDGPGLRLVAGHLGATPPVAPDAGAYLLVEAGGPDDPLPALAAALEDAEGAGGGAGTAVATTGADRARLWRWREAHSEAGTALGPVHKLDVTLPIGDLAAFCADVRDRVAAARPGARLLLFGHVGDGNVHVNVVGPPDDDEEVDDLVLGLVVERGGSISAEHGIGTAKRRWLARDRSPAEVAAMRAVKAALDPDGVLNPGALLG